MRLWMVKHRRYSAKNWWNYAFTEATDPENTVLFYDVRLFPKKKWAEFYLKNNGLDHMQVVAVEVMPEVEADDARRVQG